MTDRYDLYGPIHKGLRRAQGELLAALGAADFADRAAGDALLARLSRQLALSAIHLADEDRVLHPALAERAPALAARIDGEHDHHRAALAALSAEVEAMARADAAARPARGRALYLAFGRFVAADLQHMLEEELVAQPLLQSVFSDAELAALEGQIVGALAPDDFVAFARMMLPAMNPAERAGMLGGIRAHAPAPVFALVMGEAARPGLDAAAYARLEHDLALAA